MPKYLLILLLLLLTACHKADDAVLMEAPVLKKFEFHLHAGQQNTAPYYNNVTADVKLAVYKINYRNGESQLLWETVYAPRPLADYPHLPQKILVEKSWDVLESSEKLQAQYTIRYQSPQGLTQEIRTEELVPGDNFAFLDVEI
jgi:hypothetical protein